MILISHTRDYFAPHQIANGVPAGTDIAIHVFRGSVSTFGWDPGCAVFLTDACNSFDEVDRQNILDAVIVHAPGLARYAHSVYDCSLWLISGRHLIRSLKETEQGDSFDM